MSGKYAKDNLTIDWWDLHSPPAVYKDVPEVVPTYKYEVTTAVSYLVSTYDRPDRLPCCLWSLKVQTDPNFEVIVTDNAIDPLIRSKHEEIVRSMNDHRFRYSYTGDRIAVSDCYWSAEVAAKEEAKGQYFCLPSDDSYYTPIFQEILLREANEKKLDLVYCDMVYDKRMTVRGCNEVLDVQPKLGKIDKTGFFVNRKVWIGFPDKPESAIPSGADGQMIERLVRKGVRHGKVHEVLCVHN